MKLNKQIVEDRMNAAKGVAANPQIYSSEQCAAANLTIALCEEWLELMKRVAKLQKETAPQKETKTKKEKKTRR